MLRLISSRKAWPSSLSLKSCSSVPHYMKGTSSFVELGRITKPQQLNATATLSNTRFYSLKKSKSKKAITELETLNNKTNKEGNTNSELETAIRSIENSFGKGTVLKLGDAVKDRNNIGMISSGSLGLDIALGIGGLPRGRIVEIFGPESSGKTTLALHVIAEAHKLGGKCVFIDAEHALDPLWAQKIGVRTDELLVCQPDSGEQALDIADMLVQSGTMDVVVIDSVAALVPKAELEGEMGDHHIGTQARLMSQALRKLTGSLGKSNKTILIFINQIRHKIGVMFGSPETTPGGNALKYYCSARLDIRKVNTIKNGETVVGNQIKVKVVKNKLAPPYREAFFDIEFGKGISKSGELVDLGVKTKILEKAGAWYSFNGEKIGQGREKAKLFLEQHPEISEKVDKQIREKFLAEGEAALNGEEAEVLPEDEVSS